jgi:glycosyltransferase involved in cell wall biosynthesis
MTVGRDIAGCGQAQMKVNVVYSRMPHHACHAGYEQIERYLGARADVQRLHEYAPPIVPRAISEWLARRSAMEWYEPSSVGLEAATLLRCLRNRHEICHILYGEDSYRYLAAFSSIARSRGCRLVCTYHQPPAILDRVVPHKHTLDKLDGLIAVASNQIEYLRSFVSSDKVFLVPHGVDVDFFRPGNRIDSNGMRCLFVGQWLRDFEMLHAVVRRLEHTHPHTTFTIVTTPENIGRFADCPSTVRLSAISDDDLLCTYQQADLLVLPLVDCTANNSMLEALACGLPIVASDVGGVRDYLDPSCAFLVERGDVDQMCDRIATLAGDQTLRTTMGHHSRLRALSYDWRRVADQLLDVLERI